MVKPVKVTLELLAAAGPKGKFLAARTKELHRQQGCADLPAGTAGIVTGRTPKGCIFVFPHSTLPNEMKVFSDGHVRIVPWTRLEPFGRVG
jgi:hypothetical protein